MAVLEGREATCSPAGVTRVPPLVTVYGVDFSGARLAGRNTWVATMRVNGGALTLTSLASLETLAGTAERDRALAWLVRAVKGSHQALWGIDAPFALPVELAGSHATLASQLNAACSWEGDAPSFGRALAERSLRERGVLHVRRHTDREQRTPFDCYHYRIVYQTFHVMRDVLSPLARSRTTSILPFAYGRLANAERVVVEACPSSTLLRLGLPRRGYKQTTSAPLRSDRVAVRTVILAGLRRHVFIRRRDAEQIMTNLGGDALDAVLAGVGAYEALRRADHGVLALDGRIPREGWVFA